MGNDKCLYEWNNQKLGKFDMYKIFNALSIHLKHTHKEQAVTLHGHQTVIHSGSLSSNQNRGLMSYRWYK